MVSYAFGFAGVATTYIAFAVQHRHIARRAVTAAKLKSFKARLFAGEFDNHPSNRSN